MAQCQRGRREDGDWRARITLTGKDVEDDVGGVDVVGDRFGTRGLECRQSVGERSGQNVDHLPIAMVHAGELALARAPSTPAAPILEGRASFRRAPGLRTSAGT